MPSAGVIYRCPICHLELAFDPKIEKMKPVATSPDEGFSLA
jgi:hypothetical protein